ncbi:FAD-dependent oxidoreductase [Modestobacter versicolor]|uniref:FAD-dependent oxidoreductase n=1 Tax=Modestobacter versicolor TaxID=429133 RepID=UPI0034DF46F0
MTVEAHGFGKETPGEYHPGREEGYSTDGALVPDGPPTPVDLGTVHEPARDTVVYSETDVLVVGGGPAGCAAAIAARRAGARVTLVERYNHLGGLSTGGLVIWIDRMTDWSGFPVISGFATEILDRLPADAVAGAPRELWGSTDPEHVEHWRERLGAARETVTWSPMIDPEWLKTVSAELVHQEGVTLLLHSWVVGTLREGRTVRGVLFESKEGRRAIMAKVVIDTTGDLDVCAGAGVPFESDVDADESPVAHCLNTSWMWAGVDFGRWLEFRRTDPRGHTALMASARETLGYVERPFVGWRDDVAVFLGPRLSGYSGLKVADLTAVELESRRRMLAHLEFFRAHAPGFERAWLMLSAPQLGIRHTRRLIGLHKMSRAEWMEGMVHPDEVGVSPSPSQKYANISVPYGALVARDLDNVLAAGRHVASDPATQAFMREIPQCWLTGQAAGVAAALAVETGTTTADVDIALVQRELLRQGAHLRPAPERVAAG